MSYASQILFTTSYGAVSTYTQNYPTMLTFEQVEARYRDISPELLKAIATVELPGRKICEGKLLFSELRTTNLHTPQSLMDVLRLYNPHENCLEPTLCFNSLMGNKLLRYAYRLTKEEVKRISGGFLNGYGETCTEVVAGLFETGEAAGSSYSRSDDEKVKLFLSFLSNNGFGETVARICALDPFESILD